LRGAVGRVGPLSHYAHPRRREAENPAPRVQFRDCGAGGYKPEARAKVAFPGYKPEARAKVGPSLALQACIRRPSLALLVSMRRTSRARTELHPASIVRHVGLVLLHVAQGQLQRAERGRQVGQPQPAAGAGPPAARAAAAAPPPAPPPPPPPPPAAPPRGDPPPPTPCRSGSPSPARAPVPRFARRRPAAAGETGRGYRRPRP